MNTGIFIYAVASIAATMSLSLFILWLIESAERSYQAGLSWQRGPRELLPKAIPFVKYLNRLIVSMLPLANAMTRRNWFGFSDLADKCDQDLTRAGHNALLTARHFIVLIILFSSLLAPFFVIFALLLGTGITGVAIAAVLGLGVGVAVPLWILKGEVKQRVSLIEKRLPSAIEFMLLAMEARAAFSGAIETYCEQMDNDPLAGELRLLLDDMSAGSPLEDALLRLDRRILSPDVTAFVAAVVTGIGTGQPMRDILETQANLSRLRRFQSAELVAKTAATRAMVPLSLVIVSILILLIGPLVIQLSQHPLL